jgi:hypothetical protein
MAAVRLATLSIGLLLASASGLMAQMVVGPGGPSGGFPTQSPGAFPNQMPGAGSAAMPGAFPGQAPAQQTPPCMADFMPLRTETEKRAAAVKAAATKHADPKELCPLFTAFVESEARVVKFMEKHAASCGIPPQIVSNTKAGHIKSSQTKDKVCAAAAGAVNAEHRGPGLGEALGVRPVPTPETTSPGGGTLDSLSGNPLKR